MHNHQDKAFQSGWLGQLPEGCLEAAETATRTMEPWFKTWARGNLELMTLASRRARAYLELPERLGHCRSLQELTHESIGFWQNMVEDYTESSRRLLSGWSSIMQQTKRPEEPGRERDYVTFPEPGEATPGEGPRRAA
jgi:hypothetical protein